MATLKDISRYLGLSVTQVSRALNGHSDVSPQTRARVADAARTLGYAANASARTLKSGRSGIVAMVVSAEAEREVPDVLMAGVIGLSAEFSRRGIQFVLHVMTEGEDAVETHARLARSGLMDGFVIANPRYRADPRIAFLRAQNVPFAVHGRETEGVDYPFVDIDNAGVARSLAAHLTRLGHRRIALVDGPAEAAFAAARRQGFEAGLRDAGLTPAPRLIRSGEMTEAQGRAAAAALFDGPRPGPTAIVAGNTMLATGLAAGLARAGLRVPEDVSLVAHDDALSRAPAFAFDPPLTVTRAPLAEAFAPLADALIAAIEGTPGGPQQTVLDAPLAVGASSGPPPGAGTGNNG